jgi:hypothetical protein
MHSDQRWKRVVEGSDSPRSEGSAAQISEKKYLIDKLQS